MGFATLVLACYLLTLREATAHAAGPLLGLLAATGLVLEARGRWAGEGPPGRRLRRALVPPGPWAWPAVAALATFAAVAAPVVATGQPTWTGYGRIVDIAYVFDVASHLTGAGHQYPHAPNTAFGYTLQKYLASGYPVAGPATLGTTSSLLDQDVAWLYQPFLAFCSAVGALSAYALLSGPVRARWLRSVGAATAALATPLYAYTLGAGIKERLSSSLLQLAGALLWALWRQRSGRLLVPTAIALAGASAAIGALILPWAVVLVAAGLGAAVCSGRRPSLSVRWRWIVAATTLLAAPPLVLSFTRPHQLIGGLGGHDLGNLAAGVPAWAASGVWQTTDYRYPLHHHSLLNGLLIAAVLSLAGAGVATVVRRRQLTLAALALAGAVALAFIWVIYSPWLQFKAETLDGPIVLLCSFCGVAALAPRRWAVGVGAALVAGAVLYGDVLVYRGTTLAPYARLHDLAAIGHRLPAPGPTLYPDWEEYAGYFLRRVAASEPAANQAQDLQLLAPVRAQLGSGALFHYDLDMFDPAYLQRFRYIVQRRNPIASRPPSNYDLVLRTPYHDVWQQRRPAAAIRVHFPLSGRAGERTPFFCADAGRDARRAGPGARVVYAVPPPRIELDPAQEAHSPSFALRAGFFQASGSGSASGAIAVRAPGRYQVWLGGSFSRRVSVTLDGRPAGNVSYQESYPGQFALLGTATMAAGAHVVEIQRARGDLHPGSADGDSFAASIGPVVLTPVGAAERLGEVAPRGFARLCASRLALDWLEIVVPA